MRRLQWSVGDLAELGTQTAWQPYWPDESCQETRQRPPLLERFLALFLGAPVERGFRLGPRLRDVPEQLSSLLCDTAPGRITRDTERVDRRATAGLRERGHLGEAIDQLPA